jgi:hypothetical protein
MSGKPSYKHTQHAPLCLLLYILAVVFVGLGAVFRNVPPIPWIFPPIGLFVLVLAASFHHLTVEDRLDHLSISFGPIPLFRRTIRYNDLMSAEIGRTTILDGWGIHRSLRGGWVWNLWGRDCVVLKFGKGVLRVGTNDARNLTDFLNQAISRHRNK